MYKKMCNRVLATVVIVIAVVLSIVMALYGEDISGTHSKFITFIIKPFVVMIPVLATGALIKYLIFGGVNCCSDCTDNHKDQSCGAKKNDR